MGNSEFNHPRILTLSTLAQLAYVAHKQGESVVKEVITSGYSPFLGPYQILEFLYTKSILKFNDNVVCCGLVVANDSEIVISIRGTENLDDYFLNLLAHVNEESLHTGFVTYVDSFWSQLFNLLLKLDNGQRNIYVTGHSLGGAAGVIITQRLQSYYLHPPKPYFLETYTFGAPPVSCQAIPIQTPLYQFHNEGDFIPFLPQTLSVSLNVIPGIKALLNSWDPLIVKTISDYEHQGKNYLIEKNYQVRQIDEKEYLNFSPWVYLSRSLVPALSAKNPIELFKNLIHGVIQKSLEEHRALSYLTRLSYGISPPWMVKSLPSK
jgi:triacylglycerol lipase